MSEQFVSVVIVNYNYGRFLRQSIDSAIKQTYKRLEVIVVDDGSTDESGEIIRSYGDRIRAVFKPNGGHGSCINAGFAESKGELVTFLDADDWYLPEVIQEVVDAARCGAVLIQFRLNLVDTQGQFLAEYPWGRVRLDSGDVTRILTSRGTFTCMVSSGIAFQRRVLEKLLPLDEREYTRAPDGYLVHTVPFFGRVAAIEKPLGCYRVHGGNDSTNYQHKGNLEVDEIRQLLAFSTRELQLVRIYAMAHGIHVSDKLPMKHMRHVQLRLVSRKLDPGAHPFRGDSAWYLGLSGVLAAFRNKAIPWERRALMAGWFVAVGLLPRQPAQAVIALMMLPSWQRRIRRAMFWKNRPSAA